MADPKLADFDDSDRLGRLKALRLQIIRALDANPPAAELASLSLRLLKVEEAVAAMEADSEPDMFAEITSGFEW